MLNERCEYPCIQHGDAQPVDLAGQNLHLLVFCHNLLQLGSRQVIESLQEANRKRTALVRLVQLFGQRGIILAHDVQANPMPPPTKTACTKPPPSCTHPTPPRTTPTPSS